MLKEIVANWVIDKKMPVPNGPLFKTRGIRQGYQLLLGMSRTKLNHIVTAHLAPEIANSKLSLSIVEKHHGSMIRSAIMEKPDGISRDALVIKAPEHRGHHQESISMLEEMLDANVARHIIIELPEFNFQDDDQIEAYSEAIRRINGIWAEKVFHADELEAEKPHFLALNVDRLSQEGQEGIAIVTSQMRAIGTRAVVHHSAQAGKESSRSIKHLLANSSLEPAILARCEKELNAIVAGINSQMADELSYFVWREGKIPKGEKLTIGIEEQLTNPLAYWEELNVLKKLMVDNKGIALWKDARVDLVNTRS